jgi:undecaprenyl diphosphate synthase
MQILSRELKHIAIIMDGNGRWALQRGMEREDGHVEGAETAKNIIQFCSNIQLPYLTLYAFSKENWDRPKKEVSSIMRLLSQTIKKDLQSLMDLNISLQIAGEKNRLPLYVKKSLEIAVQKTAKNTGMKMVLALSYSGREEIVSSLNKIIESKNKNINEDLVEKHLYCPEVPSPDILIRTGGEKRISNFLIWQIAYSELFFEDVQWPDFRAENLSNIIERFYERKRTFGNIE